MARVLSSDVVRLKHSALTLPPVSETVVRSAAWAGAYGLLFIYYYSFLDYGLNLWDEGGFANGALRTYHGQMAMRDFNPIGYLPGRYIYAAWFFDWFGVSLHSLRLSVAVFTPAMPLLVFAIARRLMPRGFAVLAAAMMASAPAMYYNRFFPFFCILILFTVVRWLEKPTRRRTFWMAAAMVLCIPFKMEVSLFAAAVAGICGLLRNDPYPARPGIFSGGGRGLRPGLLGLGAAVVLLLVYLWRYQVFQKFVDIVTHTHAAWGNPFPDLLPFFLLLRELGPHLIFERLLFYLALGVYAAVLILVGRAWMRQRGPDPQARLLLAVVGFGLGAYGLVVWRAGFDNLVRTLPPFYILAAYLLFRLKARPLLFFYEMNVAHGFYVGSIGAVQQNTQRLTGNRLNVWTHPHEAQWVNRVLERIHSVTRPHDPILALPLNPLFYFLTDRTNP
ncbi:MAG: hypothetical protein ACE5ER_05700, partial [Nitrospinaceae bacterium]